MSWSFQIARIAGIEVRLHLTFLLFLVWIGFSYYLTGGSSAAITGLTFILALFLCVLLHEFGHALAARSFGIQTPDITLLPIGGVARLQRMPDDPWQELVIAIAGPIVNVFIAAFLILLLGQQTTIDPLNRLNDPEAALLAKLASVNIALVLFNLIPAFPMDGGRVLRSILAMLIPHARATAIAATIGQALAFGFGLLGLFTNPMLILIAFFIFLGAQSESSAAQMREISAGLPVSQAMVTHLILLPRHATLNDAVDALMRSSQHEFPVVAEDGEPLGVLTRDALIRALRAHGGDAYVTEFMHRELPVVSEFAPLDEAFQKMQECSCPAIPVVDRMGRFLGLITPENVGELMLVHSLQPSGGKPSWRQI